MTMTLRNSASSHPSHCLWTSLTTFRILGTEAKCWLGSRMLHLERCHLFDMPLNCHMFWAVMSYAVSAMSCSIEEAVVMSIECEFLWYSNSDIMTIPARL